MVAFGVDGVASVSKIGPDAVGQKLVMRRLRVILEFIPVRGVRAADFLQKDHICAHKPHGVAQLVQDEFAVEKSKTLVDVHGHHLDGQGGRSGLKRQFGFRRLGGGSRSEHERADGF